MNMTTETDTPVAAEKPEPTLKLEFISHGTLEAKNIEFTRKFYEEFMGFEVIRVNNVAIWIRLNGQHVYAVLQLPEKKKVPMGFFNHNGVDVPTEDKVDECHLLVVRDAEKWQMHNISKPTVQHGAYSFYFTDCDDNIWEIGANPPGGYSWMFERGDQAGIGTNSRKFERPESTRRPSPGNPDPGR